MANDDTPRDAPTAGKTARVLRIVPPDTLQTLLAATGNETFKRLVDSIRDYAVFLLTPDGRIASWNAGAERIKGYRADEIIGRHFSTFYPPEAVAAAWPEEELRRTALLGRFEDEGWRIKKDGSRFWANVTISAVTGADGQLIGYSKVTRDLTERREHERRLEESEQHLRLLIEGVQDYAIFSLDPHGVITSWNLGAQRIKGYSASEAIGKHFSIFYPQEAKDRGWPEEELRRAARDGRFEDEGWRLRKDGGRLWANVVITAIRSETGELLGYSKVTRDLTERRRQEEALREREESLRLVVEGVRDHAMFLLDAQGRIKTWNEGARRLLGHTAEAVVGGDPAVVFTDGAQAASQAQVDHACAVASGFHQSEGWRVKADGERFCAEISTTALYSGESRTPHAFVQIIRDLSQRRRMETLEAEGRRLSEFIAMLSHELRNPLAPITNAIALLKRHSANPEVAWCADLLKRQVTHLKRLVDDLLEVSRVTSGKIRLASAPLELNTLLQMALDAVRPMVDEHRHTLVVQPWPQPVPVHGDSTRLTQVIVNLVHNAAKYTPPGGRIRVSLSAGQHHATLQVADNGIGMSESLLQRAFEPFVQGERGLDRSEGGMGIGLTLVKTIVELHGGSVAAASAGANLGTTVTVKLPLGSYAAVPPPDDEAPARPATGKRVLLVDDNRDAAESLCMLLRMNGHDVQVAYDGPQAIDIAEATRPDVVLLDVGLPAMSGLEVARRLRQRPTTRHARLIAVTGYGQADDREATREAGFDAHATKPVEVDWLLGLIEEAPSRLD